MCKCWLWFSEICLYNLSNFVWHGLNPTHASGFEAMKCGIGPKVTFHKGGKVERSDVTPSFLTIFHILFGLLCSCSIWTFISPFYHWTYFSLNFYFPFFFGLWYSIAVTFWISKKIFIMGIHILVKFSDDFPTTWNGHISLNLS